jgi:hypothetical protein
MPRATHLVLLLSASVVVLSSCSSPTSSAPSERSASGDAGSADGIGSADSRVDGRFPGGGDHADAEVSRASAAEVKAFLANDPAALARLWSDEFVVTNPFNQFVNKQDVLTLVRSGVLAFTSYDRTIEYSHRYGDVVIVAGSETVVWAGKIPLAGQTSHLRYTAMWIRHGNAWKEIARHANIVLPGGPPGPVPGT